MIKLPKLGVREANGWKKNHGVFFFRGNMVQLVLLDQKEPIAVGTFKPCGLHVVTNPYRLTGQFCLNAHLIKRKGDPIYIDAEYRKFAKTFVFELNGQYLPLVLQHPDLRYISGDDRARTLRALQEKR